MVTNAAHFTAPRFATRTLIAILATVAFVLAVVFVSVTLIVRDHVRRAAVERIETAQRLFAAFEERQTENLRAHVTTLAENPAFKTALDSYETERRTAPAAVRTQLIASVRREIDKLSSRLDVDVIAALDFQGRVITASGRRAQDWTDNTGATVAATEGSLLVRPSGVFRTITAPVMLGDIELGSVQLAYAFDDRFAREFSAVSGAQTLVVSNGHVRATTVTDADIASAIARTGGSITSGLIDLAGRRYAIRPLLRDDDAAIYVLESVDAWAHPMARATLRTMSAIALGTFVLAGLVSLWLVRTIVAPVATPPAPAGGLGPPAASPRPPVDPTPETADSDFPTEREIQKGEKRQSPQPDPLADFGSEGRVV